MNRGEVLQTIPVALGELKDAGHQLVYVTELAEQITRHDQAYLNRRNFLRRVLGHVGINIPEIPDGAFRPRASKMYPALRKLEEDGVVRGEFEGPREDGKPSRRMYGLAEFSMEPEV